MQLTPETRLTRGELSEALASIGLPMSPATLASKATRGDGPPFQTWGRRPIYTWGKVVEWAEARLGKHVISPAERRADQATQHGAS